MTKSEGTCYESRPEDGLKKRRTIKQHPPTHTHPLPPPLITHNPPPQPDKPLQMDIGMEKKQTREQIDKQVKLWTVIFRKAEKQINNKQLSKQTTTTLTLPTCKQETVFYYQNFFRLKLNFLSNKIDANKIRN